MTNLSLYCVTNKSSDFLEGLPMNLVGVGQNKFNDKYLRCDYKDNIFYKEKYYSELTFHYWYWKNLLKSEKDDAWVGFCQKRRYLIKENSSRQVNTLNINEHLLTDSENEWKNYESIICKPIFISGAKKMKIFKRGWRNIIKKPSIIFKKNFENIELHFDMHHGYGNLEKAIKLLDDADRLDFSDYVKNNIKFNPHIMFISKKKIMSKWFNALFPWLERCEKEFGFENLKGYDMTRIYAFLAERYLSFWFKKYTKYREQPWAFIDE